jgi:hypothetical protein
MNQDILVARPGQVLASTKMTYLRRMAGWLLVAGLSLVPPSCKLKPKVTGPGKSAAGVTANCADWATQMEGPYRYENNIWGYAKARGGFEQCLLQRTVQGREERGWTWNWPGFDPSVFAYPEIIFGWKPWSGGPPTDSRFPLKVASIQQLSLHYHVETEATGTYNLAPEIWLTRSGRWTSNPNPSLISAEIMFWMDYAGNAQPGGKLVDRPTIGNLSYELWHADNFGSGGKWTYLALKSTEIRHQGSIDLLAVLRHLAGRGLISAEHYVASIEFGNEVMGGSGTTWIKRFAIEARASS